MAMSRAGRPRALSLHAASALAEKTICKTGTPGASSGVGARLSPQAPGSGDETAKLVPFSTMSGGCALKMAASVAVETCSFSEATNTGSGFSPRRISARTIRLTGFSPAPCNSAR